MANSVSQKSGRLVALDYMRGYFVIVIILDHLWRYPSAFSLVTGEASLWVTAAEGFVIISGFLIGYIRGFKGLKLSFLTVALKLISRAAVLYLSMIAASLLYIYIEWSDKVPSMPYTPIGTETKRNWNIVLEQTINLSHPHTWVHFLALYTIFLLASVIMVGLLRRRMPWPVGGLTILLYIFGQITEIEWLKWQIIFFVPSIAGFYFESIKKWWKTLLSEQKQTWNILLYVAGCSTLATSIAFINFHSLLPTSISEPIAQLFAIESFSPARVILALLWFVMFAMLFSRFSAAIPRSIHSVLAYIGTHSLSAYLVHGLIICAINFFLPPSSGILANTLYGIIAVAAVTLFIRLPVMRSLLPR